VISWRAQSCAIGDISVLTGQLDEYGSVRRTCQGCNIGRYATSSQRDTRAVYFCNDCKTGRYMNVTGVSACLYCPTGTIADETASTTCRACAPGSSIATLGTVICNKCSVGSYQKVSGQTSCVSCNAGFFVPSIGQTACQACEPGFPNDQEKRIYVTLVPPAFVTIQPDLVIPFLVDPIGCWASTVARLQENVDLAWKFLDLLSCFRVVRLPWRRNRQWRVRVHCRLLC